MPREYKKGAEALKAIEEGIAAYRERAKVDFQGAEKQIMKDVRLLRVEPDGTVVWELFLGPSYHHVGGSLHGGSAALILDQLTSLSIAPHALPGYWEGNGGVTRTFAVTCLRPAKINTTVQIRCKVVSIGQTAGLIHGSIVSPDGKHLFNTMEHNKVNIKLRREEPKANL